MPFKVFYAWQSDRPPNLCRSLIRQALDAAAVELNENLEIEDADRVEIDQDTQGVSGSPSIAETIFEKITTSDVFVADLTLTSNPADTKPTPNPNVLIEYGYALGTLGDQKIIGVFNGAFGSPEDLPFDLRHKRWPLRYRAEKGNSSEAKAQRKQAKEYLSKALFKAIRIVMERPSNAEELLPAVEPQTTDIIPWGQTIFTPAADSHDLISQHPWDNDYVGVREGSPRHEIRLLPGPSIILKFQPRTILQLKDVATSEVARKAVQPLAADNSPNGWNYVRNPQGCAAFMPRENHPDTALSATLLAHNGSLYGIDRYHLQLHKYKEEQIEPFIPANAVEKILLHGLENYLLVAKEHLQLQPPFDVDVSLQGVSGYQLAVKPKYIGSPKYRGNIFDPSIGESFEINSYDVDPFQILLPLFEKIYDKSGLERSEF